MDFGNLNISKEKQSMMQKTDIVNEEKQKTASERKWEQIKKYKPKNYQEKIKDLTAAYKQNISKNIKHDKNYKTGMDPVYDAYLQSKKVLELRNEIEDTILKLKEAKKKNPDNDDDDDEMLDELNEKEKKFSDYIMVIKNDTKAMKKGKAAFDEAKKKYLEKKISRQTAAKEKEVLDKIRIEKENAADKEEKSISDKKAKALEREKEWHSDSSFSQDAQNEMSHEANDPDDFDLKYKEIADNDKLEFLLFTLKESKSADGASASFSRMMNSVEMYISDMHNGALLYRAASSVNAYLSSHTTRSRLGKYRKVIADKLKEILDEYEGNQQIGEDEVKDAVRDKNRYSKDETGFYNTELNLKESLDAHGGSKEYNDVVNAVTEFRQAKSDNMSTVFIERKRKNLIEKCNNYISTHKPLRQYGKDRVRDIKKIKELAGEKTE